MSNNLLKLVINTNNNVRFIVALPSDLTIQKALPVILKKYKSIVSQNFGDHPELLNVNTVSHLTKNNCFFAKDEVIGHVLNNNDQLEITLLHKQKEAVDQKQKSNKPKESIQDKAEKVVQQQSKKQKLEAKKNEKAKQTEPKTKAQEVKPTTKKDEAKPKEPQKKAETKNDVSQIASKLLNKIRQGQKPKQPQPAVKPKPVQLKIIQPESSSEN